MSPEQTIIVAKLCDSYKEGSTYKYPAKYLTKNVSCKNCKNWCVSGCEKAETILNLVD